MQERNLSIPKPTAEQIMAEMKADIAKLERPYPPGGLNLHLIPKDPNG